MKEKDLLKELNFNFKKQKQFNKNKNYIENYLYIFCNNEEITFKPFKKHGKAIEGEYGSNLFKGEKFDCEEDIIDRIIAFEDKYN